MKLTIIFATVLVTVTGMFGCADSTKAVLESENQVKLRSMQSRRFETNDKEKALRVAMATLQDLV